jgi:hypothetical protein
MVAGARVELAIVCLQTEVMSIFSIPRLVPAIDV